MSSKLALFGASLIWGSSFMVVKASVDSVEPHVLLVFRFTVACILLCMIFYKKLKEINVEYIIQGGILGFLIFLGYSLQTIGITDTTPGKNAFLTAIYCVLVPFMNWFVDKKKPDAYNFSAAIITIIGIGLVSLNGDLTIGKGDAFTLVSGIFYAAHMVAVPKIGKNKDIVILTILQFAFSAVFSLIIAIVFEDLPTRVTTDMMTGLVYLAVFATAGALLLQNVGQKYTDPTSASIILSLESVFGVIFSVIFYHEVITLKIFLGFLLIFVAIIISETKLSFLKRRVERGIMISKEPIPSDK
ncbi:MAG: DMT family transporter [Clostridiales bacterium]|nr:DMT family transporter [Clostridiales bacterium]